MTTDQTLIVVGAAALVIIVFLLRGKIFSIKANKDGVEIDNKPPEQRPGIEVKGAVARKGNINVANNTGDGVKAEDLDAAKDISVTNNSPPKP